MVIKGDMFFDVLPYLHTFLQCENIKQIGVTHPIVLTIVELR